MKLTSTAAQTANTPRRVCPKMTTLTPLASRSLPRRRLSGTTCKAAQSKTVNAASAVPQEQVPQEEVDVPFSSFEELEAGSSLDDDVVRFLPPPEARPGAVDRTNFACDDSCDFWTEWTYSDLPGGGGVESLLDQLRALQSSATSTEAFTYWGYHIARTLFFTVQGAAGLVYSRGGMARNPFTQARVGNTGNQVSSESTLTADGGDAADSLDASLGVSTIARLVAETIAAYRIDLKRIEAGYFKAPYDMNPAHRQFNPLYVADKARRFFDEANRTLERAEKGAAGNVQAPIGSNESLYPEYYRHAFHYQSDGWLSTWSAKVYETSTETLFLGRQDSMQRSSLVPLGKFLKSPSFGATGEGARVLEIAAGTGRFATFVRDSYPGVDMTVTDLSPYYLEEARENGSYWESLQVGKSVGPASYVQANAESLPFEEASYDAVVSVYLFHELPADAQDAVFREAYRVLKPGGIFVLTDSQQLGDRPATDKTIGLFGDFAEPYYRAYIRRDFGALGKEMGFTCEEKCQNSSSKTVSFRKPSME
ncbi:methyltransferase [Pycnococcus provasolii]